MMDEPAHQVAGPCPDRPSWREVGAIVLSASGAATTLGWLYEPGRDLSSMSTYFDPWYRPSITLALLLGGLLLSYLAPYRERGPSRSRWSLWSRRLGVISGGTAALFVLVVPIVIWIVKILIWIITAILTALGSLTLYNLKRIDRGQKLYWPRSPAAMARWLGKAA